MLLQVGQGWASGRVAVPIVCRRGALGAAQPHAEAWLQVQPTPALMCSAEACVANTGPAAADASAMAEYSRQPHASYCYTQTS